MALSISFYNISDPPNKLDKTTGTAIHTCSSILPYEPISELTGKIQIDYASQADGANYCSITIGSVTQYYFITDQLLTPGHKMEFFLKRDVLMTYNTDIKDMKILATRSSVVGDGNVGYNSYLPDGLWACDATNLYYLSEDIMDGFFNYDHNDAKYILMTAG